MTHLTVGSDPPLHVAVSVPHSNTEAIDLLLQNGADINEYNKSKTTPLGLALSLDTGETHAEHLLKHGCDINKNSYVPELREMVRPLYIACFYGKVDLLGYFMPSDCADFKQELNGSSPEDMPVKTTLALGGVDIGVNHLNNQSELELQNTCAGNCLSTLHKFSLLNLTPFLMAVWGGRLKAVRHLASLGIDTDVCCVMGNAVHVAVISSQSDVLEYVVKLGCDIDMLNGQGNSPLHLAARLKQTALCQTLILNGANLNILDKHGETAFSSSVYFGNDANSLLLIQHGADLDIADTRGTTPLYWSIFNCRPVILQKLIEAGVQCTLESFNSYPRNLSIMRDQKLIGWLKNQISQPKQLLQLCVLEIRDLLKKKMKGKSIFMSIEALPLPTTLKSHVKLM